MDRHVFLVIALGPGLLFGCAGPREAPGTPEDPVRPTAPEPSIERAFGNGVSHPTATRRPTAGRRPLSAEEARAKSLIDAGEWNAARDLLGQLLLRDHLSRARAHLERDDPAEALLFLDEALDLEPKNREALLLHGGGNLRLGELDRNPLAFEDALRDFRQVDSSTEALIGASRAARYLRKTGEALRYAREAMGRIEGRPTEAVYGVFPERALAEASFDAYIAEKNADGDARKAAVLFEQTEDALSQLLGRDENEPWVWLQLANLYLWEDRSFDARSALERGLDRSPTDEVLMERLDTVVRSTEGTRMAAAVFRTFANKHSSVPLGWWYVARARFDAALEELNRSQRDDLDTARAEFRQCRFMEPAYAASCTAYETMCSNAIGWIHLEAGNLRGATRYFLLTEKHVKGGLTYELPGRLMSGLQGLYLAGNAYNERRDWINAAQIFDTLHEYEPDNVDFANNAGFFNRDGAVELEQRAAAFLRAAQGEIHGTERMDELREFAGIDRALAGSPRAGQLFVEAATEFRARAQGMFERSWKAYLAASRLEPDDVRVLNDTALIQVYHLRDDAEKAEELLMQCVRLGEQQLRSSELDEDKRWELENAWGDAHENLGVLHLELREDPARALPWFERAVEIGPDPRPLVSSRWIPRCRAMIER